MQSTTGTHQPVRDLMTRLNSSPLLEDDQLLHLHDVERVAEDGSGAEHHEFLFQGRQQLPWNMIGTTIEG